jgi:superfamily II DNA or RNA helicase
VLEYTSRDPDIGYINTNMLIPKGRINLDAVRNSLTFSFGAEVVVDPETNIAVDMEPQIVELFDETESHIIVPRHFLTRQDQVALGCEWVQDPHPVMGHDAFIDKDIACRDDEQQEAFDALVHAGEGTLNLGCGKGKTVLALKYAAYLGVPTIVIVNTTSLLEQWKKAIKEHLGFEDYEIGVMQGSQLEWAGFPIVLAMVHTVANQRDNLPKSFRQRFGLAVFDEAHHMSAPYFCRAADMFYGKRLSLTATANRTDGLEAIYQYHLGHVFHSDLTQDLIPYTTFHQLQWIIPVEDLPLIRDKKGDVNLPKVRTYLGTVNKRNEYILEQLAHDIEDGRQVLVLSHSKDHLPYLSELWAGAFDGHTVIIGETDQRHRVRLLEEGNPVFGTFQLAREGLDKPCLDTLYVLTPFSNSNDLQQGWGRIQRSFDGKQDPIVRVFEDTNIRSVVKCNNKLRKFLKALDWPVRKVRAVI